MAAWREPAFVGESVDRGLGAIDADLSRHRASSPEGDEGSAPLAPAPASVRSGAREVSTGVGAGPSCLKADSALARSTFTFPA